MCRASLWVECSATQWLAEATSINCISMWSSPIPMDSSSSWLESKVGRSIETCTWGWGVDCATPKAYSYQTPQQQWLGIHQTWGRWRRRTGQEPISPNSSHWMKAGPRPVSVMSHAWTDKAAPMRNPFASVASTCCMLSHAAWEATNRPVNNWSSLKLLLPLFEICHFTITIYSLEIYILK